MNLAAATPGSANAEIKRRVESFKQMSKREPDALNEALLDRSGRLHKQLAEANPVDLERQTVLQEQIARLDDEIDDAVFKLYGLTEEEIRVVQDSGKK